MRHDHEGRRVSRRRLIAGVSSLGLGGLLSASGARAGTVTTDISSLLAGAGTCTLTPSATQGPFYFDAGRIRSDIREGKPGVRLRLGIRVQDSTACRPVRDAVVEIWHCDAAGLYSGAEKESKGGSLGKPLMTDMTPTDDKRYLRGAQVTNPDGIVQFTTIWPGWYPGRTVHIHVMVHVSDKRVLCTQLMFDESRNAEVLARPPYSAHPGRDTVNEKDEDYRDGMLTTVVEDGDGYLGAIVLSADPDRDGR
ncbi:intradiol ring-cleavage dioxygenase [Nonomuraea diastatica]|uniref:intradiol ring-cleavage dioxygenase n=1 Tax=Nonomuraea diastatica TaxID=1848329 RepID=UPI0014084D39|nr:intradiol ring-cleavage dioxygenase [Nonomuraea diastatica]